MKRRMFINGRPVLVIRPDDPEKAVRIARTAVEGQDMNLFACLPSETGAYTVMGYASEDAKKIVDKHGLAIGKPQRGDSLITMQVDPPIGARLRDETLS